MNEIEKSIDAHTSVITRVAADMDQGRTEQPETLHEIPPAATAPVFPALLPNHDDAVFMERLK